MKSSIAWLATALPALIWPPDVRASPKSEEEYLAQVYGDKDTVSIATGSKLALRRAPAVASVITAEDIKAMGATDLDEALETVPGLHVERTPNHYSPLYVIRGIFSAYTPQTLVLQNGLPITTLFQGNKGNLWGGYPLEHIARIEVIRGPGSALYGADAYSGVINIITKSAADTPGTEIGARGGSFNTWNTWAQHGGKLGDLDAAAYLRVGGSDGFKKTIEADGSTRLDQIFATHASLAPGRVNNGYDAIDANLDLGYSKWRLRGGYKLRDDLGTGAGIASALDPVGKGKSERFTADLSWADPNLTTNWGAGFTAGFLHYTQLTPTDYQLYPPGTTFPTGTFATGMSGGPDTWERQVRLSAFATYSGFVGHSLRFGLGHDDLNLYKTHETRNFTYTVSGLPVPVGSVVDFSDSNPFLFPQRRKIDYAYLQDEWNFAQDWTLTAGVRHDRYSDFGGTTNPRVALVWDATFDLTAKLLYGHAFRAPAFNEQYGVNNPVARGNPDLKPESIETLELAFSWQAHRDAQLNLSLFRYAMKDIIRNVPNAVANTGSTFTNTGNQTGYGLELETVWDANDELRLTGNYAYQKSTDETSHQDAGYAPRHHIYARADWHFYESWLLSTQLNWVGERKRAAGDNRKPIPDYTTIDLTLRATPAKNHWDFAASVRNLFDADVREPTVAPGTSLPNDLPMAPRSFYLQASYRF